MFSPTLNPCDPFFFNDTATTEIYTLSLHDALPISRFFVHHDLTHYAVETAQWVRGSEEHTSELQSPDHLVCRLLLEKKNHTHHACDATTQKTTYPPSRRHVCSYSTTSRLILTHTMS